MIPREEIKKVMDRLKAMIPQAEYGERLCSDTSIGEAIAYRDAVSMLNKLLWKYPSKKERIEE